MLRFTTCSLTVFALCLAAGCSSSDGQDSPSQPRVDASADAGQDAYIEGGGSDATHASDASDASDVGAEAQAAPTLTLPQAIGGALLANPSAYERVPLHVAVEGHTDALRVELGTETYAATDEDGDGTWTAWLEIGGLADGVLPLRVAARRHDEEVAEIRAELRLSTSGVQLTWFDEHGPAGTPRLHRTANRLWLSWTDRSAGEAQAWMREIDGAGRWSGQPLALGDASEPALHARTALGFNYIAVLSQSLGSPYETFLRIVDFLGNEILPSTPLDPPGTHAACGGDIAFDGTAFVMVWRVVDAAGVSQVLWQRVNPLSGTVTGPVPVAESGPGKPQGSFPPFSFVKVAVAGPVSLVSYTLGRWVDVLDMEVPKARLARVQQDGTVATSTHLSDDQVLTWHRESRVQRLGDGFVVVWSAVDLTDPADTPPNLFHAIRADAQGELEPGTATVMFDAVDDRDEPYIVEHGGGSATMGWIDHRAYTEDPGNGRIELYVAPLSAGLTTSEPVVFEHARFVAGMAQLHGVAVGSNAVWTWLDERHGGGVLDPRPEVWLETAWR